MSISVKSAGYNQFSLGGLISGIGGVVGGVLTGNPGMVGAGIAAGVHAFTDPGTRAPQAPAGTSGGGIYDLPIIGGVAQAIGRLNPANNGGSCGGTCPKGFHLNKHRLPPSRRHGWLEARTVCVRNRRMNALNGRAAKRSIRRLKSARKTFRHIQSFVGPHKGRGCGCKGRKR